MGNVCDDTKVGTFSAVKDLDKLLIKGHMKNS